MRRRPRAPPSWASTSSTIERIRGRAGALRDALPAARPDRRRARLRARPARELWPAAGRPRRPSARCSAWAFAGVGWREIEIVRLPTGAADRAAARPSRCGVPSSWAWTASRSRSATSASTRWPSPSASARSVARSSSRSTSRRASTTASARSWRAWSACATLERGGDASWIGGGPSQATRCIAERDARLRRSSRRRCRSSARARTRGRRCVPVRDPRGHKGTFGTLVAVCGSLDYAGAALLAGTRRCAPVPGSSAWPCRRRCSRSSRAACRSSSRWACPRRAPGRVDAAAAAALIAARAPDALVVGPGLRAGGRDPGPGASAGRAKGRRRCSTRGAARTRSPRPRMVVGVRRAGCADAASRASSRGSTAPPSGLRRWDAGRAGARRGRALGPGGGPQGRAHRRGRARRTSRQPRSPTRPWPPAAPATCSRAPSARCLAQGCAPFDAACLAIYLHGRAAEHVRERLGDAGLLAADLPFEVARVRRHLTTLGRARRRTPPRLRPAEDRRLTAARPGRRVARRRGTAGSAARRVAGDRPRRPGGQPGGDRACLRPGHARGAGPEGGCLRPRAGGLRARPGRGRRGPCCAWPAWTRRSWCAARASRGHPGPLPGPPGGPSRRGGGRAGARDHGPGGLSRAPGGLERGAAAPLPARPPGGRDRAPARGRSARRSGRDRASDRRGPGPGARRGLVAPREPGRRRASRPSRNGG